MKSSITCPSCSAEFELTEVMRAQLTNEIRAEFETEARKRNEFLDTKQEALNVRARELEQAEAVIAQRVEDGIKSQREELQLAATEKARAQLRVELQDRNDRLEELKAKLKESEAAELQLRKRERELQSEKESLELKVAREIAKERESLLAEGKKLASADFEFKDAENKKLVDDLRKQVGDLKQKIEQGSQQSQGEVMEVALEDRLGTEFSEDTITPVGKGRKGADCHQDVVSAGVVCGRIQWESKRTKKFEKKWLAKTRDDQIAAKAAVAVIVSQKLPDDIEHFGFKDGVWVCGWQYVECLAMVLRAGLVEVARAHSMRQGHDEKMELTYDYLCGLEFQHRMAGIADAFKAMAADLELEKAAIRRLWAKREKQNLRGLSNASGLCGDLQGLMGTSMEELESLALPRPATDSEEASRALRVAAP